MAAIDSLTRTPFFFLGRRPYREAELASYLRREHRRGRHLTEIVEDPYVESCGGRSVLRVVLRQPGLIRELREDIADAILESRPDRCYGDRSRPLLRSRRQSPRSPAALNGDLRYVLNPQRQRDPA